MTRVRARRLGEGLLGRLWKHRSVVWSSVVRVKAVVLGARKPPASKRLYRVEVRSPLPVGASATPPSRSERQSRVAALEDLKGALARHPRKEDLIRAGHTKNGLICSLVPLYLARDLRLYVPSWVIRRFWHSHGVLGLEAQQTQELKEHARSTRFGKRITESGVRYVEAVLEGMTT